MSADIDVKLSKSSIYKPVARLERISNKDHDYINLFILILSIACILVIHINETFITMYSYNVPTNIHKYL